MAIPLQEGTHIYVERKRFAPGYAMPSMEVATDHYNIGYVISGNRRTIMPTGTFSYHAGDVSMMPPFVYHRTVADSAETYERILIKYTPDFVKPFTEAVGQQLFDDLYEQRVCHFSESVSEHIGQLFFDMEEEFEKGRPYREFILQGMLFRLLVTVWEEKLSGEGMTLHKAPLTPPIMDALVFIENCYAKDPSLEEAAHAANFSTAYFSRMFRAQLGMSYSEYLDNV